MKRDLLVRKKVRGEKTMIRDEIVSRKLKC